MRHLPIGAFVLHSTPSSAKPTNLFIKIANKEGTEDDIEYSVFLVLIGDYWVTRRKTPYLEIHPEEREDINQQLIQAARNQHELDFSHSIIRHESALATYIPINSLCQHISSATQLRMILDTDLHEMTPKNKAIILKLFRQIHNSFPHLPSPTPL